MAGARGAVGPSSLVGKAAAGELAAVPASAPLGMKVATAKSRTNRHSIPILPVEYNIFRKKMKL